MDEHHGVSGAASLGDQTHCWLVHATPVYSDFYVVAARNAPEKRFAQIWDD